MYGLNQPWSDYGRVATDEFEKNDLDSWTAIKWQCSLPVSSAFNSWASSWIR